MATADRGERRALMERGLPDPLQSTSDLLPHRRGDVAVYATHAGHFVAHPFRLQDVTNAEFIEPRLVTVPQPVRRQPGPHRQPGRDAYRLVRLLTRAPALRAADAMTDHAAVPP